MILVSIVLLVACDDSSGPAQRAHASGPQSPGFVASLPEALEPRTRTAECWAAQGVPAPAGVCLQTVSGGFSKPLWAGVIPGGTTWVVEQDGVVRAVGQARPVLDLRDRVSRAGSEEGLLGLAVHPRFPEDPRVFLYWSAARPRRSVIASFEATPQQIDLTSEQVILEIDQPYGNHNGGHLAFGPEGHLYVGLGDGGSGGDPAGHGQRPLTLLGSMLRLDVDGARPYGIPADNPFAQGGGRSSGSLGLGPSKPVALRL